MAAISGVKGKVTIGGSMQSTFIHKWSMTFTRDVFDVSTFDNATNDAEFIGGMMGAVGTVEGFVSDNQAATPKSPPSLADLQTEDDAGDAGYQFSLADGTKEYDFTGIVSNFAIQHSKVDGPVPFTASIESTGAITVTNT